MTTLWRIYNRHLKTHDAVEAMDELLPSCGLASGSVCFASSATPVIATEAASPKSWMNGSAPDHQSRSGPLTSQASPFLN